MQLSIIFESLQLYPELAAIDYTTLVTVLDLLQSLRSTVSLQQPSYIQEPPLHLSINIHEFLKACTGLSDELIKILWAAFRHHIWLLAPTEMDLDAMRLKHMKLFLNHGLSWGIGQSVLALHHG